MSMTHWTLDMETITPAAERVAAWAQGVLLPRSDLTARAYVGRELARILGRTGTAEERASLIAAAREALPLVPTSHPIHRPLALLAEC